MKYIAAEPNEAATPKPEESASRTPKDTSANASTPTLKPKAPPTPSSAVTHLYINDEFILSKSKIWTNVLDPVIGYCLSCYKHSYVSARAWLMVEDVGFATSPFPCPR
ncbi:hypothetical protein MAP00_008415 [Monascus purpureus]|nr:hypothetical protein MAP00_008415 [Monascus purpureus]